MGLFDRLRTVNKHDDSLLISGIRLKVRAGANPLPAPLIGAYVTAYTVASDPPEAAKQAVLAIFGMGYDVEEVCREGAEVRMSDWSAHLRSAWPEFPDWFPPQAEIAKSLVSGAVVFSPFAGWEQSAS